MTAARDVRVQRRNRSFGETHQAMIETAVRLIAESGAEALTIAALARAMSLNRTTVYYHFDSREALLDAVKVWSSEQLANAFLPFAPQEQRIGYISRFVLENPELIKLWIEQFVSVGDIRASYPQWDALVTGTSAILAAAAPGETVDGEVYCVMLLAGAIIGPRVFKNSVRPEVSIESIVERFIGEQLRMLRRDGLLRS